MKVPDKIYVHTGPHLGLLTLTTIPVGGPAEQEFIRKDALLEKLEKVAAEYKKRSDEGELVWQNMCGINQAIDILNKM